MFWLWWKRSLLLFPAICMIGLMTQIGSFKLSYVLEEEETSYGAVTEQTEVVFFEEPVETAVEWNLVLVNRDHPIDEEYAQTITLKKLKNGQAVDERCCEDLQWMLNDCRAAGYKPIICSSFRTRKKQEALYEQQVRICMDRGMTEEEAKVKAAASVALPGTSEHELGLAVDITDVNNQQIVSGMESQPVQQWLMENSWKYGFILRYPEDKSDITGIVYEPWHYRYVGYEVAKYIYENGITLEEYLY